MTVETVETVEIHKVEGARVPRVVTEPEVVTGSQELVFTAGNAFVQFWANSLLKSFSGA